MQKNVEETSSKDPSAQDTTTSSEQPSDQPQEGADQPEPTFPIWIETCGETRTVFTLQVWLLLEITYFRLILLIMLGISDNFCQIHLKLALSPITLWLWMTKL